MIDVGETRLMSTELEDNCSEDSLSSLIELSLQDNDSFLCENCHYDSETQDHAKCTQVILVYPAGFQEYISCKCSCNKENWETEEQVNQIKEQERLFNN